MTIHESAILHAIDGTYATFCAGLPRPLAAGARRLAHDLGLVSAADRPWSEVFDDAAVLGLPVMIAEGHEDETEGAFHGAAMVAHALAMIAAKSVEALAKSSAPVARIEPVLGVLRGGRDRALARLTGRIGSTRNYAWAEREVALAAAEARRIFAANGAVTIDLYRELAIQKQALAFPACQAMAAAAGWSARARIQVHAAIEGATLGLQLRGDVVDWIDDELRQGAWAVALMGARTPGASIIALQRRLAEVQILVALLRLSARELRRAADAAGALGAATLSAWAAKQAIVSDGLADDEARTPGAAVRWERERRRRGERAA